MCWTSWISKYNLSEVCALHEVPGHDIHKQRSMRMTGSSQLFLKGNTTTSYCLSGVHQRDVHMATEYTI